MKRQMHWRMRHANLNAAMTLLAASEGVEIREEIFWPHFTSRKFHNALGTSGGAAAIVMNVKGGEQPTQADPNRKDFASQYQVNDLRKGLKKILKAGCPRGFMNKTIYVMAWMAARPHIQGQISSYFRASPQVTTSMVTMIFKYRYGQLWNTNIAFRQQRPYFPGLRISRPDRCPHCSQADSGGLMLRACRMPRMPVLKDMYIDSHDQVLRLQHQLMLKSIPKGDHGGYSTP